MNTIVAEQIVCAPNPIRGRDVLWVVLWAIIITVVVGLVVGAAAGVILVLQHPGLPKQQLTSLLTTNFYFIVLSTTAIDGLTLWVLLRTAKRFAPHPLRYFFPPVSGRVVLQAALGSLILAAVGVAVEYVVRNVLGLPLNYAQTELAMQPKTLTELGVVLAAFALFVPLYEEVLFRGYLFGWLKRVSPMWLAIVISAAIFALVHGLLLTRGGISGVVGTGEIFAIGVLMAWWAGRTGSLWPALTVHVVNNTAAFVLAFLLPNWP